MSTLVQMRSRIADDLNRSDLNTQIDLAINRAIEYYYNKERFWFNETSGTFATIANQEAYGTADGIPSDIAEIDYMQITLSSTNKPDLDERTFNWIQDRNVGRATGDPTDFAWYQNKIYLYLIPNQVRTITVFYKKTYADLSLDADTNDYTAYAEDLIEARATAWLNKRVLKDYESSSINERDEADALSALRERTSTMIGGTGQIQATDF